MHLVSRLARGTVSKQSEYLRAQPEDSGRQDYSVTINKFIDFHKVSSRLKPGHSFRSGFFVLIILLSLLLPLQAAERETITLNISAGKNLNIDWDHSKNYRLQLPDNLKGNWLLSIEQRGVDVTPILISPAGEQIITTDAAILSVGIERLAFNAAVLNGSGIKLPLKTKIISPGSLSIKLQAVDEPELYLFLRQIMTATAFLQDKDAVIPIGVKCNTGTNEFGKNPGITTRCFKAAREQYMPEYKSYITSEELDYFLADSARRQGLFSDAQRLYLPLIRQQDDIRIQALSLHGLAWTVWQSGEQKVAESFAAQAIPAYKKWLRQDPSNRGVLYQLLSVRNIGCLILHDQKLLGQAEACYLGLQPDVSIANDYATEAVLIGNLGGIYYLRGEITSARAQFERVYALNSLIGYPVGQARALANIGLTEIRAGNLAAALIYYQKAVDLAPQTIDAGRTDVYRRIIANIYRRLGETQRARSIYVELESSALVKGDKQSLAYVREALALTLDREGGFELARKYYLLSLESQRDLDNTTMIVDALLALAEFETRQGELEIAGGYLLEAKQLLVNVETASIQNRAAFVIGKYAIQTNDFPVAIRYLQTAQNAYKKVGAGFMLALVNIALVDAYKGVQQFNSAEQHAKKAIQILTEIRPENVSLDLRASFSSRQRDAYEKLIDLYLEAWQQEPSAGWSRKALIWTEHARAQTLREAVRQSDSAQRLSPELQQQRRDLSDHLNSLATIRLKARENQKQGKLDELNRQYEIALVKLEGFDQLHLPQSKTKLIPASLDIDKLLGELPETGAILSMYLSKNYGVLWVLAAGELKTYKLPANDDLTTKITIVIDALRRPGGFHNVQAELSDLGKALDPGLPKEVTHLQIIADGILNYLPFVALPLSDQPGEPWLSRYTLSSSPFIESTDIGKEKTSWQGIRIFADPDYDQKSTHHAEQHDNANMIYPSDLGLYRLRGSAVEANTIAKLARTNMGSEADITILPGTKATRAAVLDGTVENTDIIHFATHGIFNSQGSSLSGLALSVVDQQGQQQPWLLTSQELYHAPINSRLVVMSACDAGTGKLAAGEGLLGMVRAFMYTGVSDVVSSQWKVSDRAAVALMDGFYTGLLEQDLSVSEALRQAQLNFVQSGRYSDPFYWAGFNNFHQQSNKGEQKYVSQQ